MDNGIPPGFEQIHRELHIPLNRQGLALFEALKKGAKQLEDSLLYEGVRGINIVVTPMMSQSCLAMIAYGLRLKGG